MSFENKDTTKESAIQTGITTKPATTAALKKATPAAKIYCGPNLPKGVLAQYTTYRGGIPKHLEQHVKNCPAIGRLFVAPEKLSDTVNNIQKAGTPENVWNKEILEYIKGGDK